MNIFEHFSCHTRLPIRINAIRDHVLEESKAADVIAFHAADLDPNHIRGFLHFFDERGRKVAHIIFARELGRDWRRLVCCKELIHILDDDKSTAQTREAVSSLIQQISVPLFLQPALQSAGATFSGVHDYIGELLALSILLPRDAYNLLKPLFDEGKIGSEDIAALAQIPETYVRFAMVDDWQKILESIP